MGGLVISALIFFLISSDSQKYIDENSGVSIKYSSGWEEKEVTLGDKTLSTKDGSAFITISKFEDFEGRWRNKCRI